ncbi:MAG TPA: alkaline phosphatase family protein [Solirubrobacteraceae bacterium]|nr:alkaline phosphatase family protein [Solirubrobacteraceae bacterium]
MRRQAAKTRHIIWIIFENHSTDQIIGPPGSVAATKMPYLNTIARSCGLAANYHAITHPSLPNYIALTSGSTHGLRGDCRACSVDGGSIFSRLHHARRSWRSYEENMPKPCGQRDTTLYAKRHNPAAYYSALRPACRRYDIRLGRPTRGPLHRALARGRLANFVLIIPNLCHDMHSCAPQSADAWLQRWLPRLTGSAAYRRGHTVIFLLTEEGGHHGRRGERCRLSAEPSCIVPLIVVGASTRPGTVSRRDFSHYSLLRTTQELLAAGRLLGHAGDTSTRSLASTFNLRP